MEIAVLFEYVLGTDLLVVEEVLVLVDFTFIVADKVGANDRVWFKIKLVVGVLLISWVDINVEATVDGGAAVVFGVGVEVGTKVDFEAAVVEIEIVSKA